MEFVVLRTTTPLIDVAVMSLCNTVIVSKEKIIATMILLAVMLVVVVTTVRHEDRKTNFDMPMHRIPVRSVSFPIVGPEAKPAESKPVGTPNLMSPHCRPIALCRDLVLVANTPAATVDVIDSQHNTIIGRVNVGIDPVGIAVRPDGMEAWVANHVSDSISVIDTRPESPTYLQVIATVQDYDPKTKATRFDEPVGIAFANNEKAYVSLSSENEIAIIDVQRRKVVKHLNIKAQDPRAIAVQGNRLYVVPFESNNQTQLSGGSKDKIDGNLVTFDIWDHSVINNNVLSIGHVVDIVKHPRVPDRDLFVFDTQTDEPVASVNTLGTLLYGLAINSNGTAFIAQTDARNEVNGRAGTKKHGLAELQNRPFMNRITRVDFEGDTAQTPTFFDLEPLPPADPEPGQALATPFAIEISEDDLTLIATASGSNKLFTLDAQTGEVIGRVDVGAVPEGIALQSASNGEPSRAWVLNAAANTVSVVDLADRSAPSVVSTIELEDPTHPEVKRGRIAFTTASSSTSGTFSCASCHPDGHTDQLLWVLNTPIVTGGNQIMPRSTMPVRGLRDTAPFHWDGIPGDPYGGNNSAHVYENVEPNSSEDQAESAARHLIDGGLASTMMRVGEKGLNDEGKLGKLSAQERNDMAKFILSIPYPPAQRRAYDDQLSERAQSGFKLFHIEGDNDPSKSEPNRCGDCHRMPFLVSTNTPGTGMDAPTWRGAYDRWLILPQGRLNIIDLDFFERVAQQGTPERSVWQFSWAGRERFDPVWDMVLEMGTGFSGAFARQATLNQDTADDQQTERLLVALENAAADESIILQAEGIMIDGERNSPIALQYDPNYQGGCYVSRDSASDQERTVYTRETLKGLATRGGFVGTFIGRLGRNVDYDHPQPAIWTSGPIEKQRGKQEFPTVYAGHIEMNMSGRHVDPRASVIVDGRRVAGGVNIDGDTVRVSLPELPKAGVHFLQLQNPDGLISNEFLFHASDTAPKKRPEGKGQLLSDVMREAGVDRLIGTWVDEGSKGAGLKQTFRWKLKDRIVEHTSKDPNNESVALIALHPESGEVQHNGGDRDGATFKGAWDVSSEGDALLKVSFVNAKLEQGTLTIRYHFETDNALTLTVELPQPIHVKMVRSKN
jgi:DNA-binding beta-propeller fold protein YncE